MNDESVEWEFAATREIPMRMLSRQTGTVRNVDEFDPFAPTEDTQQRSSSVRMHRAKIGTSVKPNNHRVSVPDESDGPIYFQTQVESSSPSNSVPEIDSYETRFDSVFTE